jgi:hypothetical protein
MNSSLVDVRVDGGVLWIGGTAYALRNITSVQPRRVYGAQAAQLNIGRVALLGVAALFAVIWVFPIPILAVIAIVAHAQGKPIGFQKRISSFVYDGGAPARNWDYYEIRIGTAGREQRVLSVRDQAIAQSLTARIAAALANPDTSFWMQVENLHIDTYHEGDNNMTVGDSSPIGTWRA